MGTTTFPSTWLGTGAYSGDGVRVRKEGPTKTIHYAGAYEVRNGDPAKDILVGSLRVATRVTSGENAGTYFAHGDHLGSVNVLTDSNGTEVQRYTYLPFGPIIRDVASECSFLFRPPEMRDVGK